MATVILNGKTFKSEEQAGYGHLDPTKGFFAALSAMLEELAAAETVQSVSPGADGGHLKTAGGLWVRGDFAEDVDDRVNTLIQAAGGLTKTYDDAAGTLTLTAPAAAPALLAFKQHNPATAEGWTSSSTTFVDVDATDLAVTFAAPSSGNVLFRLSCHAYMSGAGKLLWNLREGTADVARTGALVMDPESGITEWRLHYSVVVTGLTPGTSYTYKWGFRVTGSSVTMIAGGTDNGPALMEVWRVD